jgi:thiol:disulfide interchange protein DsbD
MISKYKTNTQPLYVLTDLGNSLNEDKPTISYVSVEEYGTWLKSEFPFQHHIPQQKQSANE